MARTKQAARKSTRHPGGQPAPVVAVPAVRSALLQLMGFPKDGNTYVSALTVTANWSAVLERLSTHPEEAVIKNRTASLMLRPDHALFLALANENTPLTKQALQGFIQAYPDIVTTPRSPVISCALKNNVLCSKHPDIMEALLQANPHLSGRQRTRTFEIMGFSPLRNGPSPLCNSHRGQSHQVDWQALENHLQEHPEEAKVLCISWGENDLRFPLEAALHFGDLQIPLSTVQLLLRICPEAATGPDSCILSYACTHHRLEDPEIIRTILQANPKLAMLSGTECCGYRYEEQMGLPLHAAVYFLLPACAAQVIPDLLEAYPEGVASDTNIYDQIPLQVATDRHHLSPEVLRILLEAGHCHSFGGRGQLFAGEGNTVDTTAMQSLIENASLHREEWERGIGDRMWQNLCLGLKAAGAFKTGLTVETMWDYPLLQAAIEFGTRQYIVGVVLEQHTVRADLDRADALGRTPLAVAIEMAGSNHHHDPDDICFAAIIQKLLDDQLHGSSQSASVPLNESLPLHRALHHGVGLEDGSQYILEAFPGAVAVLDPETKLLPCLLAAVGERARVNTIFGLMVLRPDLIAALCQAIAVGEEVDSGIR